jgi:hypothetical protein
MGSRTGTPQQKALKPASNTGLFHEVLSLTDHEIRIGLTHIVAQKRVLDVQLLLYLGEMDQRKLYREQAYPSLFEFCVHKLGFSEDVAWKRIGAARMLRAFPFAYTLLLEGRIHLTGLMLLRAYLTEDNHREWLLSASGKSKREIEKLVATRYPSPDVPSRIRRLPCRENHDELVMGATEPAATAEITKHPTTEGVTEQTITTQATTASDDMTVGDRITGPSVSALLHGEKSNSTVTTPSTNAQSIVPASTTPEPPVTKLTLSTATALRSPSKLSPLSATTYRVVLTASESPKQKLDRARELASHAVSPSDLPGLIERALDLLIASEEKRRCSKVSPSTEKIPSQAPVQDLPQYPAILPAQDPDPTANSETGSASTLTSTSAAPLTAPQRDIVKHSRNVPATVVREVWGRDAGQCTFVDPEGHRCQCRHFLQIDHIHPWALGGPTTASNCRLRCSLCRARHNEHLGGPPSVPTPSPHT